MKLRFTLMSAAGVLIAGAFTMAPSAARAADADAAVFAGATGTITTVPLIGPSNPDPGSYTFSSSLCAGVSADTDAEVGTCAISSSGTYHSVVCGTGTADGTSTITGGSIAVPGPEATLSGPYHIQFVAGVGLLTGSESADGDVTVGVVDIIPTGGNCVQGVTQFTASGAVVAV